MAYGMPLEPRKEWSEPETARVLSVPRGPVWPRTSAPQVVSEDSFTSPLGSSLPSLVQQVSG